MYKNASQYRQDIALAKKIFFMGCFFLPFLWLANVCYFYPILKEPSSQTVELQTCKTFFFLSLSKKNRKKRHAYMTLKYYITNSNPIIYIYTYIYIYRFVKGYEGLSLDLYVCLLVG